MGKTIVCFLVIELIQREKRNDDSKEERIDGRLTLSDQHEKELVKKMKAQLEIEAGRVYSLLAGKKSSEQIQIAGK